MSGYPKFVEYRGVTIKLDEYGEQPVQYSYRLGKDLGGMGYLSEKAARNAAEAAVDRKLEREAVK